MTGPYSQRDIANASGEKLNTVKQWFARRLPIGYRDETSKLVAAPYNFRTTMEFAVAAQCARQWVPLSVAFAASQMFSHFGCEKREPALPYPNGETLLAIYERGSRVIHSEGAIDLRELFSPQSDGRVTIVKLNPLFDRVCGILRLHPEAVLAGEMDPNEPRHG